MRRQQPAIAGSDAVAATNLELVTLTEDSAVVTWYTGTPGTNDGLGRMVPCPADGEVVYGTHPERLVHTAYGDQHTAHHHVEVTGLEPGQTYYYQARSRGMPASATPLTRVAGNAAGTSAFGLGTTGPFSFTTPQPPPGEHLFSIALCNDLHLGETVSGLVAGRAVRIFRGVAQLPGRPPYPDLMSRAMVAEVQRRGASHLLAGGDISAESGPADLARAKEILDGFGPLGERYLVVRGNHDRRRRGGDSFRDTFFGPDEPTYFSRFVNGLRIVGLDTYEQPGNGAGVGRLTRDQLAWFAAELRENREQPTLVVGHHPLTVRDSAFPITWAQTVERSQAAAIVAQYAVTPGVFLHHAGHTHRNKRTVLPGAPGVTMQEVAAAKDYPGGFTLLRIHTGGYALNHYPVRDEAAREWTERSRRQIWGYWPQYALGRTVGERNSMVVRDFSGLRAAEPPSRPSLGEPVGGLA
jgi:hypothetical protein